MIRFYSRVGIVLLSLCSQLMQAEEAEILLNSGASVVGDLLKETTQDVIVDLGFDVLKIPRSAIQIVKKVSKPSISQTVQDFGEDLYREDPKAKVRPLSRLVEDLGGAVVMVRTSSGLGSGFIIHPDGYVITNDHVIAGEREISVTIFRKTNSELIKDNFENVRIVASGGSLDLALLKIEGEKQMQFPTVPLGNSSELNQGDRVFAIGSPLGLERSVSEGIVSLRNRLIRSRPHIQTTAEINPGNSGGPLFNYKGEVVGVNNMKVVAAGAEGLGFSIPVRTLKTFLMNRDAYSFDPKNPNAGFLYLSPPSNEFEVKPVNKK
jgi:serine protease Do